jgi:hypothetical protein
VIRVKVGEHRASTGRTFSTHRSVGILAPHLDHPNASATLEYPGRLQRILASVKILAFGSR